MKTSQKYNSMIRIIEESILPPRLLNADEIINILTKKNGISIRDLGTVFTYLTGTSLYNYIRERKLMASYRTLITQDSKDYNIEKAIAVSGYDNQSSFTKAFSKRFGISPRDASKKKDTSMLCEPVYWDSLTDENDHFIYKGANGIIMTNIISKIVEDQSTELINVYEEMESLIALYNFNDDQATVAYEVAAKQKTSLKEAFQYVNEYLADAKTENIESIEEDVSDMLEDEYFESENNYYLDSELEDLIKSINVSEAEDEEDSPETELELLRGNLLDSTVLYCYFQLKLSVCDAIDVSFRLFDSYNHKTGKEYEITDFDHNSAWLYANMNQHIQTSQILRYGKYFTENYHGCKAADEDVLAEYAYCLDTGLYMQDALEEAITRCESDILDIYDLSPQNEYEDDYYEYDDESDWDRECQRIETDKYDKIADDPDNFAYING